MRYTFVKQHDATDCAAACLAMICLHYKKETTITKLRDMMGTDLKGTNLIGLSKSADELGFASQAVRVDKEGFISKYTLPCIANIITKEGLSHFVVIFKITEKDVIVGDPAKDLIKITIDELYKDFTGVILVQPTLINYMFRLSKFPPAALSEVVVATATTHSSALQAENLSCAKHIVN